MSGGRRGFFDRIRSVFQEADPSELKPTFVPERPAATGASNPGTAASQAVVRKVVRPPGALAEAEFLAACTRCDACVSACPEQAIVKSIDDTPMLVPERVPCILCADVPCAAACPSGALLPIAAHAIAIGRLAFFEKLCLNHHEAESCSVCLDWCPIEGVLTAGPRGYPVVDAERCTGCGACARHCVAYPRALGIKPR